MRFVLPLFTALSASLAACGDSTGPGDLPDMRATYSYSANVDGVIYSGTVSIADQTGGAFSGTYSEPGASFPVSGSVNGVTVNFTIQGPGITINNNGTLSNGSVTGTYVATATGVSGSVQGSFTLTRTG